MKVKKPYDGNPAVSWVKYGNQNWKLIENINILGISRICIISIIIESGSEK